MRVDEPHRPEPALSRSKAAEVRQHQACGRSHDHRIDAPRAVHEGPDLSFHRVRRIGEGAEQLGSGDAVERHSPAVDAFEQLAGVRGNTSQVSVDLRHYTVGLTV
jgi:hypothetical protein